ncbi:MAG: tetratricopeptide repeat protein [Verrucomicrobiota bacterium]|jgi:tetratricopeptide (TPR) repeat protein
MNMTRDARNQMAVVIGLAAVTLAVYWPVTGFEFINYDDNDYFYSNVHVLGGLTLKNVLWAFRVGDFRFFHPLTWLSLMLDMDLSGKGAGGPHFTNLLLHTANAVLLFLLLRRLTGAHWRSAVVAGLFALHPLRVESVAWIAERKDVLSAFFGLLSLIFYARYVSESKVQSPKSKTFYGLALFFFALGLLSKPMLVTWPFVMLLLDYWPLGRVSSGVADDESASFAPFSFLLSPALRRLVWEKIPFFMLSLMACALTFLLHEKNEGIVSLVEFPLGARIENAFVSYARYLGQTFWPMKLAVSYPLSEHWPWMQVVLAVVLVMGLSLAAVWLGRRRPYVFVGWFWFLGTLVPVIGLAQAGYQAMADRFTYIPLIGVFLVLVWGASEAFGHWRTPKTAIIGMAVLMLTACAFRTRDQLHYWQNSETLFRHALAVTENNYVAYYNLGNALVARRQLDEAQDNFRNALQIRPDYAEPHNNLGIILVMRGNLEEAIQHFHEALRFRPNYADAHLNLGFALVSQGKFDEAIQQYLEVLRLSPDNAYAHLNLGIALARLGRRDEAVAQFLEALRLKPDFAEAKEQLRVLGVTVAE